jgi:hypothetical protein
MKRIDLVPELVGVGGGLVDGTLQTFAGSALGGHVPTIFRAGLVLGGAVGWAVAEKPGDVSYTLLATGLYGLSSQLVPSVNSLVKSSSAGSRIAGAQRAAGCTACGDFGAGADGGGAGWVAARPLLAQPYRPHLAGAGAYRPPDLVTNPPGGSRESVPGIL